LLVLEEASSAGKRGAKVYAEVAGFGAAQSLSDSGGHNEGLELAIRGALRDANLKAEDIDAVIPQGCGIPGVDAGEAGALRSVFGSHLDRMALVTVTPSVGDCAAGNGSILAAVAALCVKEQKLPARGETRLPGKVQGSQASMAAKLRAVLVCSSAQGGQNAAVVIKSVAS
jgi:3-oxoacyl-(acyl-carrier-protein) synthase